MTGIECSHAITQGKASQKGSWCNACGVKVYDVDEHECRDCESSKKLIDGWICSKHLMAISPSMNVTYKISEGTCWKKRDF